MLFDSFLKYRYFIQTNLGVNNDQYISDIYRITLTFQVSTKYINEESWINVYPDWVSQIEEAPGNDHVVVASNYDSDDRWAEPNTS